MSLLTSQAFSISVYNIEEVIKSRNPWIKSKVQIFLKMNSLSNQLSSNYGRYNKNKNIDLLDLNELSQDNFLFLNLDFAK